MDDREAAVRAVSAIRRRQGAGQPLSAEPHELQAIIARYQILEYGAADVQETATNQGYLAEPYQFTVAIDGQIHFAPIGAPTEVRMMRKGTVTLAPETLLCIPTRQHQFDNYGG